MIGYSNNTLEQQPIVHAGEIILCPRCGKFHILRGSDNPNDKNYELLLYYKCGGNAYIAAVANRLIVNVKPDVTIKEEKCSD